MLSALIDHPAILALAIIALGVLNYGLGSVTLRTESRQRFVERVGSSQPAHRAGQRPNLHYRSSLARQSPRWCSFLSPLSASFSAEAISSCSWQRSS
jgi:hypothetical protein